MVAPRLSIRSAKARDLARRLAQREGRTVAEIVELALEAYDFQARQEKASSFYARLAREYGTDLDLDAIIRGGRNLHAGPKL